MILFSKSLDHYLRTILNEWKLRQLPYKHDHMGMLRRSGNFTLMMWHISNRPHFIKSCPYWHFCPPIFTLFVLTSHINRTPSLRTIRWSIHYVSGVLHVNGLLRSVKLGSTIAAEILSSKGVGPNQSDTFTRYHITDTTYNVQTNML